ncbi:hypothetical protein K6V92_00370 [Cupriavidus respiraculi]|uniref:hypothetical protein n=1 Tax=Cupriavidus respiraculi TaxID=195930 RepID=UPI001C97E673|nr:hypothetical protein [Cupriavidus respiraculi]MBY4945078.1 hypothetical protein [Cupriavidus respiraculi]
MAKAKSGGGGGPDVLLIAAVGAMAYLALRSRTAVAGGTMMPAGTAATLRPDYTAQRNIAYTQAGLGLLGTLSGLFGAGSPDAVWAGGRVSGWFGGGDSNAIEYNNLNGYLGQLGIDATNGYTPAEFGNYNGAYTFGSPVEFPSLGELMGMG